MLRSGQIPNMFLKIVEARFIERLDILKRRDESVILRYWLSFTIKGKIGHKADFMGEIGISVVDTFNLEYQVKMQVKMIKHAGGDNHLNLWVEMQGGRIFGSEVIGI